MAAARHPWWNRFVTPGELDTAFAKAGLRASETTGVVYRPLADCWQLSADTDVNYMMVAENRETTEFVASTG